MAPQFSAVLFFPWLTTIFRFFCVWGLFSARFVVILFQHATAVTVAMKNKMDLSIGVAIGSSTQIALFLIPFVTLLGWAINQPMSLNFSGFETICLVMSVLMVNFLVKNGESNWLQGSAQQRWRSGNGPRLRGREAVTAVGSASCTLTMLPCSLVRLSVCLFVRIPAE